MVDIDELESQHLPMCGAFGSPNAMDDRCICGIRRIHWEAIYGKEKQAVTRHRRIYLASSWRNYYQANMVGLLRQHGHEVYDFRNPTEGYNNPVGYVMKGFAWSDLDPEWQGWDNTQYRKLLLEHPVAERGFQSDWQAMEWADTGVLLLPSGRSAHIEAGYFVGAGKELHVVLTDPQEPELMYRMATAIHLGGQELVAALA